MHFTSVRTRRADADETPVPGTGVSLLLKNGHKSTPRFPRPGALPRQGQLVTVFPDRRFAFQGKRSQVDPPFPAAWGFAETGSTCDRFSRSALHPPRKTVTSRPPGLRELGLCRTGVNLCPFFRFSGPSSSENGHKSTFQFPRPGALPDRGQLVTVFPGKGRSRQSAHAVQDETLVPGTGVSFLLENGHESTLRFPRAGALPDRGQLVSVFPGKGCSRAPCSWGKALAVSRTCRSWNAGKVTVGTRYFSATAYQAKLPFVLSSRQPRLRSQSCSALLGV